MMSKKNCNKKIKKTPYEIKENTKYFVKNRLPAFILAFLIIFWTVASVFGLIGYFRSKDDKKLISASADVIESDFTVRDFDIPLTGLDGFTVNGYIMLDRPWILIRDNTVHVLSSHDYYEYRYGVGDLNGTSITTDTGGIGYTQEISQSTENGGETEIDIFSCTSLNAYNLSTSYNYDFYAPIQMTYYMDWSPTQNAGDDLDIEIIIRVGFYSFVDNRIQTNLVGYYDYKVLFRLQNPTYGGAFNQFLFPRLSFVYDDNQPIANENIGSVDLSEFYLPYCREYCYRVSITDTAYQDGMQAGVSIGYNNGFAEGVASANDYTFTGLLSAVFDVPVKTFRSLFNFDLLGINLANFFFSLLTCAVIIMIIRWII